VPGLEQTIVISWHALWARRSVVEIARGFEAQDSGVIVVTGVIGKVLPLERIPGLSSEFGIKRLGRRRRRPGLRIQCLTPFRSPS
jgi:hypothetical protein